jgi:hypothetical protein
LEHLSAHGDLGHLERHLATVADNLRAVRRLLAATARGGAYTFGGGKGLRTGSGLSLARIALSVRMRGENG